MARTAIDKRDHADPPRVEQVTESKGPAFPIGKMLISSPRELDALIRRVPEGRVVTLGALRANLAKAHGADFTCPLTTGIFLRIVGEAAEEERAARGGDVAPYWRVVRDDGALIETLPGGTEAQARRLVAEDVTVLFLGKVPKVTEVSHFAWTPPALGKHGLKAAPAKRTGRR
jgi:alkylated DNA nucleotide flippase Atl1